MGVGCEFRLVSPCALEPHVSSARTLLSAGSDFGAPLGLATGTSTQLASGSDVEQGD